MSPIGKVDRHDRYGNAIVKPICPTAKHVLLPHSANSGYQEGDLIRYYLLDKGDLRNLRVAKSHILEKKVESDK